MRIGCRYYALAGTTFSSLFKNPEQIATLRQCLDQCLVASWESNANEAGSSGIGQALEMLSHNAERFAPLDVAPAELQEAWWLLSQTLNAHAKDLLWASSYSRAGLTSPESVVKLVSQIHKTKCLELLLPTPISGPVKASILALCRFLETHSTGGDWILAIEDDLDKLPSN